MRIGVDIHEPKSILDGSQEKFTSDSDKRLVRDDKTYRVRSRK